MGTGISPYTKSQILRDWLAGKRRAEISLRYGISAGAVSNVVEEWRARSSRSEFDSLREFVLECRRSNISVAECALGMRIITALRGLGVKEDQMNDFVLQVYDKCRYYDISPDTIASIAKDVAGLVNQDVPISEISKYVQQKAQEKVKADHDIKMAINEKNDAETQLQITLHNNGVTMRTLNEFIRARELLGEHDIRIDGDLPKLVNLINNSRLLGFDPNRIQAYISNIADLEEREKQLHESIKYSQDELIMQKNLKEITFREMEGNISQLETYYELNSMGFGLEELLSIREMAKEFEVASQKQSSTASSSEENLPLVKLALKRLRESRLLEQEVESLREEKTILQQEIIQQNEIYTKHMESAAEKAIERVVDYSKKAIQSISSEKGLGKQIESSGVSPILVPFNVNDSVNSTATPAEENQEVSDSEAIKPEREN